MFSFRGRIGRWDFFKYSVALALSCVVPAVLAMGFVGPIRAGNALALPMLIVLIVVFIAVVAWIGLGLQAKRLRDIGWNPLYTLPAWFVVQVLDAAVATMVPRWSVAHDKHATIVGALFNLGFILALTFWPGEDQIDGATPLRSMDTRPVSLPGAEPTVQVQRAATPSGPSAPRPNLAPGGSSFGRRGLAR